MAERLEHLTAMRKVTSSNPTRAKTGKLTVHSAVNGYLTYVWEGLGGERR